ncbi:unnamed protein product [Lepeophtheirus salmonis]|uniref:(salmon louse) hypothetical protein n=1 Tax=Lepeophtheirus salmonis TaxID=72036 RepID=A0A7R8CVR9_LEPSM|nr:unnamed protein product [Lepeophtheirus salmonis]CAF2913479.1 unnamed protein product [Lepeophtheirus salmonis]
MLSQLFWLGVMMLSLNSAGSVTSSMDRNGMDRHRVTSHNTTLTPATFGRQATFKCTAKNLYGQKTVSWVRHRDVNLLAVGKFVYIRDPRFKVLHESNSDDWFLVIKSVDYTDEGVLRIFEPTTEMLGESTLYVDHNSSLNLTCVIHSPNPPAYVFWKKNSELVEVTDENPLEPIKPGSIDSQNASSGRKVLITFLKNVFPGITSSSLWIDKVNSRQDSGTYSCIPSNSDSKTIVVHVLKGKTLFQFLVTAVLYQ